MIKKLTLAMVTVALCAPTAMNAQLDDRATTTQKFGTLLYYIDKMYVDSVDAEELVEIAIVNMLGEMDPHSVYIPADELKAADEPLNGSFEGVGIQFNIFKDTILVVSPISGGPSERLGILSGDRIITVDGEEVAGIGVTNKDVQRLLKGPKGTVVTVGIKRSGVADLIEFEITRDKIPIFSVDATYMVDKTIGYIKVNRFSRKTMEEFNQALDTLKQQGMKDLVLDLQGNGGGMLRAATEMADAFLSGSKMIVYTEGRAFPRDETYASQAGAFESGRLVVLIDQGSASASEIVSGSVQDWDRGLIVGRRSFGKGLVQRPVNLPDGSAVRLTVQKYYTPSGRCIQKSYEDGVDAYRKEKYERFESGELMSADSIQVPDSLIFKTRLKERTVYGGGGIVPDIFVPIDTMENSSYLSSILRKGLDSRFALTYVDKQRDALLAAFPSEDIFLAQFQISNEDLAAFKSFLEEEEVEFDEEGWDTSERVILLRLKAMIGRNMHKQGTFYRVISPLNETLEKAIEILQDGTFEKANLAHRTF